MNSILLFKIRHHFYSLDLEQVEGFVLGKDLSGLVAVQVHRKTIGIEPKLFGHLWER